MDDIKITDSPIYVCEICDKFFYDRSSLEVHYKAHKEYACPKCQKKFKLKDHLINHTRSNSCKQRFACEFCKKTFDDDNQLKCHIITHDETRNYICGVCKKAFRYRHVLVIHSNVCHPDKKPYVCDVCNEPFPNKSKLKVHIKEHKKEFDYICDDCKKGFSNEKAFKIHSCKTDEKPHVCSICLKTFKVKSSLTRHSLQHVCNGRSAQSCKKKKISVKKRISVESLEK